MPADVPGLHNFLYVNGAITTFTALGASSGTANAINDAGEIVGACDTASGRHAFLYSDGAYSVFDFPGANGYTEAFGINNSGEIAGTFRGVDGNYHGFLDANGVYTAVNFPGSTDTYVYGINNAGAVVGTFDIVTVVPEPFSIVPPDSGMAVIAALIGRQTRRGRGAVRR